MPFRIASRKKWYLIAMCLDLGVIFGALAKIKAPLLSSKIVEYVQEPLNLQIVKYFNNEISHWKKISHGLR